MRGEEGRPSTAIGFAVDFAVGFAIGSELSDARIGRIDLQIHFAADPVRVWQVLTEETDRWWLAEYRATGPASRVRLGADAATVMR